MLKNQSLTDDEKRLYGDIDSLVTIKVEGHTFKVPENLELLRCFQYLDFKIAFENFCWNANCENCAATITKSGGQPERTLCCQEPAVENLSVEELPAGVRIRLP